MNKLNVLFSLSSLSVVLVTVERFSPTTQILLAPHGFLRLHELVQMTILILLTVIIPFLILREVSGNFETLKSQKGFFLAMVFVVGIYFYATGNGVHEVSSFNFNNFCNIGSFSGDLCTSFFFNDYYTGNIFYFLGGIFMIMSLLFLERLKPSRPFNNREIAIMLANAIVYAFAIFAYSGFDRVLVGLVYSVIVMVAVDVLFLLILKKYRQYPVTYYSAVTYTLGTIAAIIFKLS